MSTDNQKPNPKFAEFTFDSEALDNYPGARSDPAALLDGICSMNPGVPRKICAALAAQIMQNTAEPIPGHEEEFTVFIAYMIEQAEGIKVEDGTPGHEWSEKIKRDKDWRQ